MWFGLTTWLKSSGIISSRESRGGTMKQRDQYSAKNRHKCQLIKLGTAVLHEPFSFLSSHVVDKTILIDILLKYKNNHKQFWSKRYQIRVIKRNMATLSHACVGGVNQWAALSRVRQFNTSQIHSHLNYVAVNLICWEAVETWRLEFAIVIFYTRLDLFVCPCYYNLYYLFLSIHLSIKTTRVPKRKPQMTWGHHLGSCL